MKSLKDYESIKEFIELLEYQGMNNEKSNWNSLSIMSIQLKNS